MGVGLLDGLDSVGEGLGVVDVAWTVVEVELQVSEVIEIRSNIAAELARTPPPSGATSFATVAPSTGAVESTLAAESGSPS